MSKQSATAMLTGIPVSSAPAEVATSTPGGEPGLQPAPKPELDSTRFAQLAKKESELQRQREEFKKEQTSHASEMEKMKAIHKKLQDFEDLKVKDPVAALKLAGFTETDLFNFIAQAEDKSTPEEKAAKAASDVIKKYEDANAKKEEDAQKKRNDEVLTQFRGNISSHITSDKDKYEYCNYNGALAEELVLETVSAIFQDSKEIISVQEAVDMVEQYYEDQDKLMSSLKKRQPKPAETQAPEATPKEQPLKPEVSPRNPSRTMSSKTAATVASTKTIPAKETSQQKRERLIQKLGSLGKQ